MTNLKRTPLFEVYRNMAAKRLILVAGSCLFNFQGLKQEHEAVRTKAGLFDVSHMGEVEVKGNDSLAFLQKMHDQ